ncbi:MAG: FadR family transcriptional regulator [OCS116 cluster bacterium]|nr:FadR family transcriptional regulator [OCS116 cluster bacterium]
MNAKDKNSQSTKKSANNNLIRALRPIKKRTRDMEVIDALIEMIEAAGLQIGDRLPTENELAKKLNVGRSTIREALKSWQGMGIITRNKGAGTILAAEVSSNSVYVPITLKLEAESLLRTHGVRSVLEIEATRLAAIHASEKQRRLISARLEILMYDYELGDDWRAADALFHGAINQASGNPLFGQMIKQLHDVFNDIYVEPLGEARLGEASIPLHRELAKYVVEGNPNEAVRVMKEILEIVQIEVKAILNER